MQKIKNFFFIAALVLLFTACQSTAPMATISFSEDKEYLLIEREAGQEGVTKAYPIPDISPAGMKIRIVRFKTEHTEEMPEYVHLYNKGIDLMRAKNYNRAISHFLWLASVYSDRGRSLYNIGLCYYDIDDLENALKYFASAYAVRNPEAINMIGKVCFKLGYKLLEQGIWVEAIRYFKISPAIEATSQNVLYCYAKHIETLAPPEKTYMLLYAGNYMVENKLKSKNVIAIAFDIGNLFKKEKTSPYLEDAAAIIRYALTVENTAYLRYCLGEIYLNQGDKAKAVEEFKTAKALAGSDVDLKNYLEQRLKQLEAK